MLCATLVASILLLAPRAPDGRTFESGYNHPRAVAALARVASQPHPVGSRAQAEVREFLLGEIEASGASYELQRGRVKGTDLTNILVLIPGADTTGTVLLVAHYDTVPRSPGAGDDSSGVVALLEVIRALSGTSPRNDLAVLFTDGEERGLLGARLFTREHPLIEEVDVVLNFEAIGNAGPLLMFETGPGSGGLINLLRETVPYPFGNSLAAVIYSAMPNDTDMSVFRDRGIRGLNFAVAGASGYYHSPADTPTRFSGASLAHMGDTAVRMAARLAEIDLEEIERDERAFLAAPPFGFLIWSHRLHILVACAALVAMAISVLRRRVLGLRGFARGTLAAGLLAAVSGASTLAAGTLLLSLGVLEPPLSYDEVYGLLLVLGLASLGGSLALGTLWIRGPHAHERGCELIAGALAGWAALSLFFFVVDLSSLGASYPFAAGSICLCAASALQLFHRPPAWQTALILAPAVFLLGPILGPLAQLASQALPNAIVFTGILMGLGSLLLAPVVVGASLGPVNARDSSSSLRGQPTPQAD